MMRIDNLTHPAVEIQLPLNSERHHYVIPTDTTLFFWRALAPGTADRLAPTQTSQGKSQMDAEAELQEKVSWSVSLADQTVPLLRKEPYRNAGYRGMAWWAATESVELPAVLTVQFEITGAQPTVAGEPLVCWTDTGRQLPWNQPIESTISLHPPGDSPGDFETHRETLWQRHRVYAPVRETMTPAKK